MLIFHNETLKKQTTNNQTRTFFRKNKKQDKVYFIPTIQYSLQTIIFGKESSSNCMKFIQ